VRRGVQRKAGVFAEDLRSADALIRRGELDDINEWLTQPFFARERQHVKVGIQLIDAQGVTAVIEKGLR
jgi:hypothetical protein